ncbi:hypothetical protein ACFWY9_12660 [Amycolatopsis sp. NPDC059027]|uniref:hypothetical protein n=1 Tax=unclassified Amycolatopsis TaxID=2618356 RepID=UPI00366D1BC4
MANPAPRDAGELPTVAELLDRSETRPMPRITDDTVPPGFALPEPDPGDEPPDRGRPAWALKFAFGAGAFVVLAGAGVVLLSPGDVPEAGAKPVPPATSSAPTTPSTSVSDSGMATLSASSAPTTAAAQLNGTEAPPPPVEPTGRAEENGGRKPAAPPAADPFGEYMSSVISSMRRDYSEWPRR